MKARRTKPLIAFLDAGTLDWGDADFAPLEALGRLRIHAATRPEQVVARASDADVVITNKVVLDERVLRRLPRLKLVCVAATGANNIDLAAAKALSIAVANVEAYSTDSVAEHALLLLLCAGRKFTEHARAAKSGTWSRSPFFCVNSPPFSELKGKTLGIVGYGAIGKKTAALARAFGMTVILAALPERKYPAKPSRVPWRKFLAKSDFITLHCPLTAETKRLVGTPELAAMKQSAVLVNVARGGLIDEAALAAALRARRIAGFAADVLTTEPPPPNHPLLAPKLSGRVQITPHVAWASHEARIRLMSELAKNIRAFHNGCSRNRIV